MTPAKWEPPERISRAEIIYASERILGRSDIPYREYERIVRIEALGLDWDIGAMIYAPEDSSRIAVSASGKKVGVFMLHGGTSDYKNVESVARMLAGKFGIKVVSMTFPGRLYLQHPSRDWPDDTVNPDGTMRTPVWKKDELITPDQFEVIKDVSNKQIDSSGKYYGSIFFLDAKPGTMFRNRMAAWPVAFEEAMKTLCRLHLPEELFSIYTHGHSTGGPFVHYLTQRVANIEGLIGFGTGMFGHINAKLGFAWEAPFQRLRLRTWRDLARYNYEDYKNRDLTFPAMMELVLDEWQKAKARPNFKAEDFIHKNSLFSLKEAAQSAAARLRMNREETEVLIHRYLGYCRELSGPGIKPVPPILFTSAIGDDTVSYESYKRALPIYAEIKPRPKVRVVLLEAGIHRWTYVDKDLPKGIIPIVTSLWYEAIMNGFFPKAS